MLKHNTEAAAVAAAIVPLGLLAASKVVAEDVTSQGSSRRFDFTADTHRTFRIRINRPIMRLSTMFIQHRNSISIITGCIPRYICVENCLLCTSVQSGVCSAADIARLESFLNRCKRLATTNRVCRLNCLAMLKMHFLNAS